ncbi:OmpH family outer membrane protein [Candidatus Sumerlaeota bacterium]|nr:OmpH family outer membrane protein [Candidatus Sumerlaeota bacterium]
MRKKWRFLGVSILICGLAIRIGAQDAPLKIAYADLDRIMVESESIRQIVGTVQDDIKKEQESLADKMNKYKVLSKTLDEQKTILTHEQIKNRRLELEDLKISIEDQQQSINRMIRRSERELVEPAIERINHAIKEVSEKEKLDLVLRNDLILFSSERCNITDQVIQMIDLLYKQEKEKESPKEPSLSPLKKEDSIIPAQTPSED